jgi:hypothetical protein
MNTGNDDARGVDAGPNETAQVPLQVATDARSFLQTIFEADDHILIRPMETWTEHGRRGSKVLFTQTKCRPLASLGDVGLLLTCRAAASARANVFYGVCPRVGPEGYDQAWQIRTVRWLWSDIDHTTPEEAVARCETAGLPKPSLVVNSGNGAHLYWRLESPWLIDDVGPPPQVASEWVEIPRLGNRRVEHFDQDGERVQLHDRTTGKRLLRNVPELSPKALHIQDVLAGIAKTVGGDHTHDLARLLRVPSPLNRKNERNGQVPVPTSIVHCSETRYDIAAFERFADQAPSAQRRKQISQIPLPAPRKLTAGGRRTLDDRINACRVAQTGTRSEIDFGLCAFAIGKGYRPHDIWPLVADVGKFAEGGESYFQRTWAKAEQVVRVETFERAEKATGGSSGTLSTSVRESHDRGIDVVTIDDTRPVAVVMGQITDVLTGAGNTYIRAGTAVRFHDDSLVPLEDTAQLAGLLNSHAEVTVAHGRDDSYWEEFKPLPPNYASTWLNHCKELARLPEIKLFTKAPTFDAEFDLVPPGYHSKSGILYAGPAIEPAMGTPLLDALLSEFCFLSETDRVNYLGMLVTVVLISHFIGSKPAALITGNQPNLGKSILAQILAILRDGRQVETCSYNDNDEEFEKRIAARVRSGQTTLNIDNAKTNRGTKVIDSPCLERCITDPVLSFRKLGHSSEIRAENSHIVVITANTPDIGRDLITRCVPIRLFLEGDPRNRRFTCSDPEQFALDHRVELLAELCGMVERWKAAGRPMADVQTRFNKKGWGRIVGGVLEANGRKGLLGNFEETERSLDPVRAQFEVAVQFAAIAANPVRTPNEWSSHCAGHQLLEQELGNASRRSRVTSMGHLLTRFSGQRFVLESGEAVVLRCRTSGNNKSYCLEATR